MHILIIADSVDNQKAGVYIYTKNLIENLLKIDHQNHYSFVHRIPNDFFKGTKHHIIRRLKIPGYESLRRHFLIPRLAKKVKADLVLEPCHIGPFNLPKNIKKAVTVHDLTPILFPQFHTFRSRLIHHLFFKKSLQNADLILVPSETTKKDIENFCHTSAQIVVTPLGANHVRFPATARPIKAPYFLYLGTIEPRKNLKMLIQTFLELKEEEHLPHKLVLAGEIGWKTKKLRKLAKSSPEIHLLGYLSEEEKANYLKHADIFIYPSHYEGFGLPPLEAMSYKIPVVCSTGGSLKEIFSAQASTFDPQDQEGLKIALLEIIREPNLKKLLSEKGQKFSQKFTWEITAQKTLEAFNKILFKNP